MKQLREIIAVVPVTASQIVTVVLYFKKVIENQFSK